MKKSIVLILILCGFTLFAQEKEIKKPEYIIIANNEIISKEKLGELGKQGLIKAMNKGVTEKERNEFAEKFGDKIGDREFIIKIDLLSEKEKAERQNKISENIIKYHDNGNVMTIKHYEKTENGIEMIRQEYFYKNDYYEAMIACKMALDIEPNMYVALAQLGSVYYMMEYYEDAIAMYEKAMEINPDAKDVQVVLTDLQARTN